MQMTQTQKTRRGLSDRTLNRLIIGIVVVLVIGIPLIGVIYFMDRSVDPGPSLTQRQVSAAEDAVRNEPNNVAARVALAAGYAAAKRYPDSIAQYGEVLTVVPDHHGALLGRGNTYLAMDDPTSAAKDFQRLVDIAKGGEMANADPQLEEAYFRLGSIALDAGRNDEAVADLAAAVKINRTDADALALLGAALLKTGKPDDALTVLARAVALVPTGWCDPYQTLAQAYTALGKPQGTTYANAMVSLCTKQPDVARTALQGITSGEFLVPATLGLAFAAQSQGDIDGAIALFQKVLTADPQNFTAISGIQALGGVSSPAPSGTPASAPASAAPAASPSSGTNP